MDKCVQGEEVFIERRGDLFRLSVHKKEKVVFSVHEEEKKEEPRRGEFVRGSVDRYGCGCEREVGRVLCGKHGVA